MDLLNRITKQKWFLGVRREESLLFYSMSARGGRKYLPKFGLSYVDRLLVPIRKGYMIRVLNEEQASRLHGAMKEKVLKNPTALSKLVEKDRGILDGLVTVSAELKEGYKKNTDDKNRQLFEKSCDLFAQHSAYVYVCFSAGVQLTKNINEAKDIALAKKALKEHDQWRNSITFSEEEFGKNIFYYLRDELANLEIRPARDYNYLDIRELLDYLQSRKDPGLKKKIAERKKELVYLALGDDFQVVTDSDFINEVRKFVEQIDDDGASEQIKGRVPFGNGIIKGEIMKVLDIKKLKGSLQGKILVTRQTTPHFIPYLKGVKAIVTDEGGITCHAAIISRELEIPCVIGTKIATDVLKDGDMVEVDADNGVVRILK